MDAHRSYVELSVHRDFCPRCRAHLDCPTSDTLKAEFDKAARGPSGALVEFRRLVVNGGSHG